MNTAYMGVCWLAGGGVKRFAYPGSRRLDSVDAKLHAAADTNGNHAADKNSKSLMLGLHDLCI